MPEPDRFKYFRRKKQALGQNQGVARVEEGDERRDGSVEFEVFLSADMALRIEGDLRENHDSDWLRAIKDKLREVDAEVETFDESRNVLHVIVPYDP